MALYNLIEFVEKSEGESLISVVPTSWVCDGGCWWPPKHLRNEERKLIKFSKEPDRSSWDFFTNIRLISQNIGNN